VLGFELMVYGSESERATYYTTVPHSPVRQDAVLFKKLVYALLLLLLVVVVVVVYDNIFVLGVFTFSPRNIEANIEYQC